MCLASTSQLIFDVVTEFTGHNQAFTAFDVSREVQSRAKQDGKPVERHQHIKDDVHREIEQYVTQGIYVRVLHDVGAPTKAFLYHPAGYDPANYVPINRSLVASAPVSVPVIAGSLAVATPAASATDDDDGDEQDKGRLPDARGTVCVPNYLLRAAGFSPKSTVHVRSDNRSGNPVLVISADSTNSLVSYTVDYHNNVRITSHTLQTGGVSSTDGYDFERDGNEVLVKSH